MSIKNYFYEDYWSVGVIEKDIEDIFNDDFFDSIYIVNTPKNYFLADPFYLDGLDNNKFLCEYFNFEKQKGEIYQCELNARYDIQSLKHLKLSPLHMSFPNFFVDGDKSYLIPENSEAGELKFYEYRVDSSEISILNSKIILNRPIVDPVVFKNKDTYYMFCTVLDENENSNFRLFYSKKITEGWSENKNVNFKGGYNGARMAGNIIKINNKLFRLGQNCVETYGGGISIFEIDELSPSTYSEKLVHTVNPPLGFGGIHTINSFGNKVLIDLKVSRFSLFKPYQRLRKKLWLRK